MKRILSVLLAAMLLLALAACGNAPASTPSLQLGDNGDNTLTVTAENAKTDAVCFGQITLGENEGIQLEADFENSGELIVRFVPGEFGAESFPDEASELTIVGFGGQRRSHRHGADPHLPEREACRERRGLQRRHRDGPRRGRGPLHEGKAGVSERRLGDHGGDDPLSDHRRRHGAV